MEVAIDSSTPALVGGSVANLQTSTFSPPAGSLLVACLHADPGRTYTVSSTVVSTTWTQILHAAPTGVGSATAYYAPMTSGATNMSVSAVGSITNDFALKVYVITGHDTSTPIGAVNSGGSTADTGKPLSKSLVPQAANSLGFVVADDLTVNDVGATSSPDTTWSGYDVAQNIAGGSGYRVMGAAGGTETFTVNVTGVQGAQWAWGLFEVRAAPGGPAVTNKIIAVNRARYRAVTW